MSTLQILFNWIRMFSPTPGGTLGQSRSPKGWFFLNPDYQYKILNIKRSSDRFITQVWKSSGSVNSHLTVLMTSVSDVLVEKKQNQVFLTLWAYHPHSWFPRSSGFPSQNVLVIQRLALWSCSCFEDDHQQNQGTPSSCCDDAYIISLLDCGCLKPPSLESLEILLEFFSVIIKINELVIRYKSNKYKVCQINICSSSEVTHIYVGGCKINGRTPGSELGWCLHQERLKLGSGDTGL